MFSLNYLVTDLLAGVLTEIHGQLNLSGANLQNFLYTVTQ